MWTEPGNGGAVGGRWQTQHLKGPSLVWKWRLQRADMIKCLTFTQNARGCLGICCVLCGYLAALKHMGNQHAHIISGNIRMALQPAHTVTYLKDESTQKEQLAMYDASRIRLQTVQNAAARLLTRSSIRHTASVDALKKQLRTHLSNLCCVVFVILCVFKVLCFIVSFYSFYGLIFNIFYSLAALRELALQKLLH